MAFAFNIPNPTVCEDVKDAFAPGSSIVDSGITTTDPKETI